MANARQTSPLFSNLLPDNRSEIYQYFTTQDFVLFGLAGKKAGHDLRFSLLFKQKLLHLAAFAAPVLPNQKVKSNLAVINLLRLCPELLFVEGEVKDPAGHTIFGSVYKVFLGAGDVWARKTVHEEIIPLIENGEAIAEQQYKEQFPRHADTNLTEEERLYDDRNIAQMAQVKIDLEEIVAAFEEDPCTGSTPTKGRTINAINRLLSHLAPKEGEVIKTGMHMPPQIMQMIHQVYDKHYDPWPVEKLRAYSLKVIGGAEKAATAVDAQCYRNGIANVDMNLGPDRTSSYFISSGTTGDLAASFFIDIYFGAKARPGRAYRAGAAGDRSYCSPIRGRVVGYLCRTKTSNLRSLCSHAEVKRPAV